MFFHTSLSVPLPSVMQHFFSTHKRASKALVRFCFLVWVLITGMYSTCENSVSLMVRVLLCIYYTSVKNSKYISFFSGISLQATDFPLTNFDAGPCLILVNVNLRFSDEVCECAGNDNYVKSHLVAKIF